MSTSENNIENKPAKDIIDVAIYEKNLRVSNVLPIKKQDILIVFLNNRKHISVRLSSFKRIQNATEEQLSKWILISNGIGIEWPELDEDLSLKGLIQQFITENTISFLAGGENTFAMAA
ncbi:MAG: DUF2442 domain-containing protein [Bacteroidetes bacterium]|nr:DUF2442 domain-containing protein [Bacteroidota bacterium]